MGTNVDGQTVLEEEIDDNYEPTEQEIMEYAMWLGIDTEKEKDLLFVAREGLKAPLPEQWKPCKTPAGDIYYFNFGTGESIWDHPCDEFYRKLYQEEKKKKSMHTQGGMLNKSMPKGPSPLGQGQPKQKTAIGGMGVEPLRKSASPSSSLHTSFDALPATGIKPLGSLRPLNPLSGSGSDWKSPATSSATTQQSSQQQQQQQQQQQGQQPDHSPSRSMDDDDARTVFRSQLEEERMTWERRAQSEYEAERDQVERQHKKRMEQLREDLESDEISQKRKMLEATESLVAEFKRQMEAQEAREKEEISLEHKRRLNEMDEGHREGMAVLKHQYEEAEEQLKKKVASSRQTLADSELRAGSEVEDARDAALEKLRQESVEWADTQKAQIRQQMMEEAMKQVEDEITPLRTARRDVAMAQASESMGSAMEECKKEMEERKQQLAELELQLSSKRKMLKELEEHLSDKRAAASAADVEISERGTQIARIESEVRAKQRELSDVDRRLLSKMSEHDEIEGKLRVKQKEVVELDSAADRKRQQIRDLGQDAEKCERELSHSKLRVAAQSVYGAGISDAEVSSREEGMRVSKAAMEDQQRALAAAEAAVSMKQGELTALAVEVGRQRAESLTRDMSMAQELRTRADEEYQRTEAELRFTKSELSRVGPQLSAITDDLAHKESQLASVSVDLAEKKRRSVKLGASLVDDTAALAEVESRLADSRAQLDRVAALLLNSKAELDYEAHSKALTGEEMTLLEVQRARMERAVDEQVHSEKQLFLSKRLSMMRLDVERLVSEERTKREAAAAVVVAAAVQSHQSAAKDKVPHSEDSQDRHYVVGVQPPLPFTVSPKLPALQIGGSESDHAAAKIIDYLPTVAETPHDIVRTTDPHRSMSIMDGSQDLAASTNRLQRSLEALIDSETGTTWGDLQDRGSNKRGAWPRYDSAADTAAPNRQPGTVHHTAGTILSTFSEDDDSYSLATGRTATRRERSAQQGLATYAGASYSDFDLSKPSMLSKARVFVKQQKRSIKERQFMIQKARDDWKVSMSAADSCPDPAVRLQQGAVLRQVKDVLEDQAHRLNADANQLRGLKLQITAMEGCNSNIANERANGRARQDSTVDSRHHHHHHHNDAAYQHSPTLHGTAAPHSHVSGRPLYRMDEEEDIEYDESSTAAGGEVHVWRRGEDAASLSLRQSLERISRALNKAIQASSSHGELPKQTRGAISAATQQFPHTQSSRHVPAWQSAAKEESYSGGRADLGLPRRSSFSSGLGTDPPSGFTQLDRLRDDRDLAHALLHNHSTWLTGFRTEIGRASSGGGAAANAGWRPTTSHLPYNPSRVAASSGRGVSYNASRAVASSNAGGTSAPLRTLDIGGGQEIMIAVRQK